MFFCCLVVGLCVLHTSNLLFLLFLRLLLHFCSRLLVCSMHTQNSKQKKSKLLGKMQFWVAGEGDGATVGVVCLVWDRFWVVLEQLKVNFRSGKGTQKLLENQIFRVKWPRGPSKNNAKLNWKRLKTVFGSVGGEETQKSLKIKFSGLSDHVGP